MTNHNDIERLNLVQKLAEAVSTQARVANRTWLILMTVAVLVLVSKQSFTTDDLLQLPFGFGKVDPDTFFIAAYSMLVVLTIAFAAAHAQQIRSAAFAQSTISALAKDAEIPFGIHLRDFYDMVRVPSVIRVASLPQLLQGKRSSYAHPADNPTWLLWLSVLYYVLLKVVSWFVYFCLPAHALWHAYIRVESIENIGSLLYPLICAGIVATVSLTQVVVADAAYLFEIASVIGRPKSRRTT